MGGWKTRASILIYVTLILYYTAFVLLYWGLCMKNVNLYLYLFMYGVLWYLVVINVRVPHLSLYLQWTKVLSFDIGTSHVVGPESRLWCFGVYCWMKLLLMLVWTCYRWLVVMLMTVCLRTRPKLCSNIRNNFFLSF